MKVAVLDVKSDSTISHSLRNQGSGYQGLKAESWKLMAES